MKAWLACLDIDVNDLCDLFEMFDDGDGRLTIDEFLQGALRLKGSAQNIDMARILCQLTRLEDRLKTTEVKVANESTEEEIEAFRL